MDVDLIANDILIQLEISFGPLPDRTMAHSLIESVLENHLNVTQADENVGELDQESVDRILQPYDRPYLDT